jgi:hypothetical protein
MCFVAPPKRHGRIDVLEHSAFNHFDRVVTGRVVDEMDEAVAQASVALERRRYVDGERQLGRTERELDR